MKIKNILLIGLATLTSISCSNFLDEFSQTYIRASKISDYDELLLGSVYMRSINPTPPNSYLYPGGGSCDFFNVLTDDINTVEAEEYPNTGGDNPPHMLHDMSNALFGYSAWQKDLCHTMLGDFDDAATWTDLYQRIAILNTTLAEIDRLDISTDKEKLDKERVKGEAYFLRAQFYLILTNLYGKPYNPSSASSDLGVPLKISSGVEHDKDKDTQFERTTLDKIYAQIISDLETSLECLKKSSKDVIYRASEKSTAILLSRVYLYTQEWEKAKNVLQPYLASNKFLLASITDRDFISEQTPFLTADNIELIFSQGSLYSEQTFTAYAPDFCVTKELYNLYDEDDVRKGWFKINAATDSIALSYKYQTGWHQSKVSDIFMIRSAEAYLNMAEACAMLGNDDALANQYLNQLRKMRIKNYTDQTYNGEQLVEQIRNERRKELCFEGQRWFDLRRYSVANPYPFTKKIYRKYSVYKNDRTLDRTYTYVLQENDLAYTFDIPQSVKDFDIVPMPGNERPVRNALEE